MMRSILSRCARSLACFVVASSCALALSPQGSEAAGPDAKEQASKQAEPVPAKTPAETPAETPTETPPKPVSAAKAQRSKQRRAQRKEAQKREERRARTHISAAYPRSAALLDYLAERDRRTFEDVLGHSRKIARRQAKAALAMARKHHPEIARLIVRLRGKSPAAYDAAIRNLVADMARIERAEARGPKEHELALTEWKLRSQARLVAARMAMRNDPRLSAQLDKILTQGESAKRRQLQMEIKRHERHIERLRRRLAQDPAKSVQSQVKKIQRQARNRKKSERSRRK